VNELDFWRRSATLIKSSPAMNGVPLISLVFAAFVAIIPATAQPNFTQVHPRGPLLIERNTNQFVDVAFNEGRHVVVGEGIYTSTDEGRTWSKTVQNSSRDDTHNAIIFADNKFIAVGAYGSIATSSDGLEWTLTQLPNASESTYGQGVAFGGGRFVVTAGTGRIDTSEDALNWRTFQRWSSPAIAYGNGRFVTLALFDAIKGLFSPDGETWTEFVANIPVWLDPTCTDATNCFKLNRINDLIFLDGQFLALTRYIKLNPRFIQSEFRAIIFTSADGQHWTEKTIGGAWPSADGRLTPIGDRIILTPFDGIAGLPPHVYSWDRDFGTPTFHLAWIDPLRGVAGTESSVVGISARKGVWRTADYRDTAVGTNWIGGNIAENLVDVARSGSMVVGCVAEGSVLVSTNKLVTSRTIRLSSGYTGLGLSAVEFGANQFVVVGQQGSIFTATNGVDWTKRPVTNTNELSDVIYSGSMWVAVGAKGTILSSSNGAEFTARNSGVEADLNAIVFAEGKFVAVGDGGTILTSPDGITWALRTTDPTELRAVTYGAGKFVAFGSDGTARSSSDTVQWDSANVAAIFSDVGYANGLFVACDGTAARPSRAFYYSTDAINWTESRVSEFGPRGVSVVDGENWLTGERLSIWRTAPTLAFSWAADGAALLAVQPDIPADFVIQSAESLARNAWQPIATFSNINSPTSWSDTNVSQSTRFYRVVRTERTGQ
jgi:photosystem II stability/assembly factor-like uncharacterized protein